MTNREIGLKYIADHVKKCAYTAGVLPKTFWDSYMDDEIKALAKWSEVKKYL